MFGNTKRMNGTSKFVMEQGRKVGNLKGRGTAPKTAPLKKVMKQSARPAMPVTLAPARGRKLSKGKAGPVHI